MSRRGQGKGDGAFERFGATAIATAVALAASIALGTATASADDLSMTFTEARANVGVQLADQPLFEAPDVAPFEAEIDPATGVITGGQLTVPQFSTWVDDVGVDGTDVTVDFEIGPIWGTFDRATGALSLSGTAGGMLTAQPTSTTDETKCTVSVPGVLTLSTGDGNGDDSRLGAPFTRGLTGAGAIAGQWSDMTAEPRTVDDSSTVCQVVEDRIKGEGGIWLEHAGDLLPPVAPQLTGTDPASPGRSGTPRIRGMAEPASTVRIYAGAACAGVPVATASAAELGSPGILVSVAEGVTATFSAKATDVAGNTSTCSAPISFTHAKAPASEPDDPDAGSKDPPKAKRKPCVVPKLVGKTLKRARKALRNKRCKVGKVRKPARLKRSSARGAGSSSSSRRAPGAAHDPPTARSTSSFA